MRFVQALVDGNLDAVRACVEEGADVSAPLVHNSLYADYQDRMCKEPLNIAGSNASEEDQYKVGKYLLEQGADHYGCNMYGQNGPITQLDALRKRVRDLHFHLEYTDPILKLEDVATTESWDLRDFFSKGYSSFGNIDGILKQAAREGELCALLNSQSDTGDAFRALTDNKKLTSMRERLDLLYLLLGIPILPEDEPLPTRISTIQHRALFMGNAVFNMMASCRDWSKELTSSSQPFKALVGNENIFRYIMDLAQGEPNMKYVDRVNQVLNAPLPIAAAAPPEHGDMESMEDNLILDILPEQASMEYNPDDLDILPWAGEYLQRCVHHHDSIPRAAETEVRRRDELIHQEYKKRIMRICGYIIGGIAVYTMIIVLLQKFAGLDIF